MGLRTAFALAAVLPLAAHAQVFYGLAVTARGELYFSVGPDYRSSLALRTPKPLTADAVYSYSPGTGVRWFAPPWGPVNGFIDISADGTVAAANEFHYELSGPKPSGYTTVYTSRILAPGFPPDTRNGRAQLSRNGQFALVSDGRTSTLYDLRSGASRALDYGVWPRQAVTGNGAVLHFDGADFVLDADREVGRFSPAEAPAAEGVVDEAGTRIAYISFRGNVRVIDLATRGDIALAKGSTPSISADGRVILFFGAAGWSVVTVGGPVLDVTPPGEDLTQAVLSADGKSVYAVSWTNRILRIDVETRAVTEIVPRTPAIHSLGLPFAPVPGSLATLYGFGLSDRSIVAPGGNLPTSLDAVRVVLDGRDVPLLSTGTTQIQFQVPFEARPASVALDIPSRSPFAQNLSVTLERRRLLFIGPQEAIHQDFSSLATFDNPARPGEIVHFYAVGLGPTSPPVPTGAPAPAAPPARAVSPVTCSAVSGMNARDPIPVLYAGLAPGFYGVYQVSIQLPDAATIAALGSPIVVRCSVEDGDSDARLIPVRIAP